MTKEEKAAIVEELSAKLAEQPNFYLLDMGGMSVAQSNTFRAKLFEAGLEVHMFKNTLIKKALEGQEDSHGELYESLKQPSSLILVGSDNANAPAKVLKEFRKGSDKPTLKAAFIESSAYIGDDQIEGLSKLKSKAELLGEIIGLLQSPMANVMGSLKSGGDTLHGLLQTLAAREN